MVMKSSARIYATKCDVCGKECFKKSRLKVHSMIHTGEKPLKCRHCDKSFRYHSSLSLHETTHTGKKQFNCQFCDKKFASSSTKKRHESRLHSDGEKPYHCVICWKTFTHWDNLKAHKNGVHLKIRPFKCPSCGKTFYNKYRLERHAKSHAGAKAVLAVEPTLKISSGIFDENNNPLKLKKCSVRLQKLAYIEEAIESGCTSIWIPSIVCDPNIYQPEPIM